MPKYNSFAHIYEAECQKIGQNPLKWVLNGRLETEVVLDVDRVPSSAWPPLIKAVSAGTDFTKLCVYSSSGLMDKSNVAMRVLIEAVSECVAKSPQLADLEFIRLDLGPSYLIRMILNAVTKNVWLRHLAFDNCSLDDEAVAKICDSIKSHPSLGHLLLAGRKITRTVPFADLIKHQKAVRLNSVERRRGVPGKFVGLTRLSLIDCPNLGTPGFRTVAESLFDNDCFKALDMINCGIDKRGIPVLDSLLGNCQTLVVLDLRSNPILSAVGDLLRQKLLILSYGTQRYPVLPTSHHWECRPTQNHEEKPKEKLSNVLTTRELVLATGADNSLDALLKSLVEEREARKRAEHVSRELRKENEQLRTAISQMERISGFTESTAETVEGTFLKFQAFLDSIQQLRLECEETPPAKPNESLDQVPVKEGSNGRDDNSKAADDYSSDTFESDSAS